MQLHLLCTQKAYGLWLLIHLAHLVAFLQTTLVASRVCAAFAQVHTQDYPDGFIRGDFNASQVVDSLIVTPQPNTVATVPEIG